MLTLGYKCHNPETLFNEYKEFTINKSDFIDNIPIDIIKKYNKGYMDETLSFIIRKNILQMIEKYFSRYYTSFNNTEDNNVSTFTIGINDDKIITGIPIFNYESNIENLYKSIYKCIEKQYKNVCDMEGNVHYISNFELNLIPIRKKIISDVDELNSIIESFNNIQKIFKKNTRLINHYKSCYKKWNRLMYLYGIKLTTVLDHKKIRKEFVSYILELYSSYLLNEETETSVVIEDYTRRRIILDVNFYNPILKKFKDDKRAELKSVRPVKPNVSYKMIIESEYYRLMRLIPNINSFVTNRNITYIIIEIKIYSSNTVPLYYKKDNSLILQRRVIIKDSPGNANM